jgi:parallel beta-helix repeat protein
MCPGDSLQAALDAALPGQTVSVFGTCSANILIRNEKQRITLDGNGSATVTGAAATNPVFNVRGKGILIQGFAITGGSDGIYVNRGSNAVVHNNEIHHTSGGGIVVEQLGFAVITGNNIHDNPEMGIFVNENSTARIGLNSDSETAASPNVIQTNGIGIVVSNGSSARISGNTISGNNADGINVLRDSHADIAGNVIANNGGDGVEIGDNSAVQLGEDTGSDLFSSPNTTTAANTGFGVKCLRGGIADGKLGSLSGTAGTKSFAPGCIDSLLP